jgi:hypothetical protein
MINQYDKNLAPIFEIMGIEFFSNAWNIYRDYTPKGWSIICKQIMTNSLKTETRNILKKYVVDNIWELNKLPNDYKYSEIKKLAILPKEEQ